MRRFSFVLLFLCCFLAAGEVELTILATTDTHGRTYPANPSWEQLSALIRQRKSVHPDAVLADCGDTFQGSYAAFATGGRIFAELLGKLRYDLFVPGNHDFEFGGRVLQDNLRRLAPQCTVLAANLESLAGQLSKPCCVRQTGKVKVGFIGLTETQIPFRLTPEELAPFRLCGEKESLARAVALLKAQNVSAIVLLRHNGLYSRAGKLTDLIRPYPEIKLVIGGHTHELNPGSKVGHALFVQAGCHAQALAEAVLVFEKETGRFLQCRSRLYPVSPGDAADPEIAKFLKENSLALPFRKNRFTITQEYRKPSRLALEAMLRAVDADAAIMRASREERLLAPETGIFSLYRSFPYANRVMLVKLTPEEFRKLILEQKELDQHDRFQQLAILDRSRTGSPAVRVALPDYLLAGSGRDNSASVLKNARNLHPDPPCLLTAVIDLLTAQKK